jgi:hypothetical protein
LYLRRANVERLKLTRRDRPYYTGWNAESFLTAVHSGAAAFDTECLIANIKQEINWGARLWTEFRFIKEGYAPVRRWEPAIWEPEASFWEEVRSHNLAGYNIYFGILPRLGQKGKAENVPWADMLWADVDAKHFKGGKEEAWESIHKEGMSKPGMVVDTGHGYHLYWHLSGYYLLETEEDRLKFGGYLKGIAKHIGGDTVHDVSRLLRVAYTINWKDEHNPVIAEVVETNPCWLWITEFDHLWTPVTVSRQEAITFEDVPPLPVSSLRVSDKIKQLIEHPPDKGERSEACFKVIRALHRAGCSPTEIKAIMKQNPIGRRYYE